MAKSDSGALTGGLGVAVIAYGLATLSAALWGSNAVVGRAAVSEIPPLAMTFWRMVVVVLTLLPFSLRELWQSRAAVGAHWAALIGLAILGPLAFNLLMYYGLTTSLAINASLFNSATPVAIVVAAWLIIGERINLRIGFGMLLAFAGVVVIVLRGSVDVLLALDIGVGDSMIVTGMASWAVYSVFLRRRRDGLSDAAFLTVIMAVGVAAILPIYLISGVMFALSAKNVFVIVFSGAVISVIANLSWIKCIGMIGPSRAGQFHNLIPVFGATLAVVFLGEVLHAYHAAGFAAILLGVYLATRAGERNSAPVR